MTLARRVGFGGCTLRTLAQAQPCTEEPTWVQTAALNHSLNPVFMGKCEVRSQGTGDTLT